MQNQIIYLFCTKETIPIIRFKIIVTFLTLSGLHFPIRTMHFLSDNFSKFFFEYKLLVKTEQFKFYFVNHLGKFV